jgi:GNAT superfamily N-acetyltransferase
MPGIIVRPLTPEDYADWHVLWQGYITFYKSSVTDRITQMTWARIHDPFVPMHGWCAVDDTGKLTGIVHALERLSTWSDVPYVYLEDLFVAPEARTGGIGRALIEAVYAHGDEIGSSRVYWHTKTDNLTAQKLYDRIASDKSFMMYKR